MEENTIKVNVNTEECSLMEEVHYMKITLPKKEVLLKYLSNYSIEHQTTLPTGVLSKIENSFQISMANGMGDSDGWKSMPSNFFRHLRIYGSNNVTFVGLFIKFSPASNLEIVTIKSNPTATFADRDSAEPLKGVTLTMSSSPPQYTPQIAGYSQYEYKPTTAWPDQECVLIFHIPIMYRKLPVFEPEAQVILGDEALLGKLDPTAWFNSKIFSDVVVECSSRVYHAHQIVLAGHSPVFRAMLTHPTKEAEKGRIVIKDVEPEVFEALLRFSYTGKVNPDILEAKSDDLYRAANMYDIKDLLLLCEVHLLQNVTPENALLIYDLAQCRPQSALAKKSRNIIQRNRSAIASDVNSFKNFTIKYPELIFDIFTS